jgi:hypothetical protein
MSKTAEQTAAALHREAQRLGEIQFPSARDLAALGTAIQRAMKQHGAAFGAEWDRLSSYQPMSD